MALAKDETRWDGGYPNLAQEVIVNDEHHPEWHGSNIYGLIRVTTDDGKQHLVGTVSKAARIVDFTTGKTVFDFSSFGAKPRSGGDSYGAVAFWRGRYYFGGWVITPHPAGSTFNTADKYTYLISTTDLVNWTVHIKDKSPNSTSWQAEISDLVPTNDALFILRGDIGGAGTGTGLWKYDGTSITQLTTEPAIRGSLNEDVMWYSVRGSTSIKAYDTNTNTNSAISMSGKAAMTGGTSGFDATWQGKSRTLAGAVHLFTANGYLKYKPDNASAAVFVPIVMAGTPNDKRVLGWRSQVVYAAGGIVVAANTADPARLGNETSQNSMLLWIGPNGQAKVLDTGGLFSGIAIFADRLYYGVSANPHGNNFNNHQVGGITLNSIPLSDIKKINAPIHERIYNPPTINGLWGGYPTLGYRAGKAILTPTNAGTLTIWNWSAERTNQAVGTVAFAAGETKVIDLAPFFAGGLMGFNYSVVSNIEGSVALW
jgi:hypothetical protein